MRATVNSSGSSFAPRIQSSFDPGGWRRIVDAGALDASTSQTSPTNAPPPAPLPDSAPLDHPADLAAYLRACRLLVEGRNAAAYREHALGVLESVVSPVTGSPDSARSGGRIRDMALAARWGELRSAILPHLNPTEAERLGRATEAATAILEGDLQTLDDPSVGRLVLSLRARALLETGGTPETPSREALTNALATGTDPRRWYTLPAEERARNAVVLLDAALGPPEHPREVERALDAFGFPPGRRMLSRVLLQLARIEGVELSEFVEPTLVHGLDEEALLLQIIPRGRPGDLGATLADALEHRLRMGLATEVGFAPEELLLRVEARHPHPAFFSLLTAVMTGREYQGPDGTPLPINDWIENLQAEAQKARESGGLGVLDEAPFPGPLGEARREARRALRRVQTAGSPIQVMQSLVELFRGDGLEQRAGPSPGLRSLLALLETGDADQVFTADSQWEDLTGGVPGSLDRLVPREMSQVAGARWAGERTVEQLAEIRGQLASRLPTPEAALAEDALEAAGNSLDSWVATLRSLEGVWRDRPDPPGRTPEEEWSRVLKEGLRGSRADHQALLVPLIWRALIGESVERVERHVGTEERLLRWAVGIGDELSDPELRRVWLEAVAEHWRTVMDKAIETGLETRVSRLLRHPGARALALLPGIDETLERARLWLFDCYRIGDGVRVTRTLNIRRGRGTVRALPRDLLAFFLHYSPVWLALLVGAVLMLDFGDAWTAMAEVGDVRGIGITFALGVLGAFAYVTAELQIRVRDAPGDHILLNRGGRVLRSLAFVGVALAYTLALVTLLWWLLSGTGEVVHGSGALLHIVVWSGFALFVGIFFGLLAKAD